MPVGRTAVALRGGPNEVVVIQSRCRLSSSLVQLGQSAPQLALTGGTRSARLDVLKQQHAAVTGNRQRPRHAEHTRHAQQQESARLDANMSAGARWFDFRKTQLPSANSKTRPSLMQPPRPGARCESPAPGAKLRSDRQARARRTPVAALPRRDSTTHSCPVFRRRSRLRSRYWCARRSDTPTRIHRAHRSMDRDVRRKTIGLGLRLRVKVAKQMEHTVQVASAGSPANIAIMSAVHRKQQVVIADIAIA